LHEIHNAMRELILDRANIDPDDIDISFEAPTKEWIDGLTRPTLDISMIDVQENLGMRQVTPQTVVNNGHAQIRMPRRRVDLRYLITALTTDAEDSYRLLWRALVALMRTPELPPELLPEDVRAQIDSPMMLRVAQPDVGMNLLDAWGSLGAEA